MLGKKVNILLLTLLTLLSTAVSAAVNTQYNATVCGSGTYLFGCKQLTSSGTETNTLGDSTVTLHLLFAPLKATSYTATIEPGQTYLFGCQRLTADAVASNTLQQVGCGCDRTVNLPSKVQAHAPTKVVVGYTATIQKGETYLFGCATYASDTTVSDTLHLLGVDSITVLTLKVCQPISGDTTITDCDSVIFKGIKYTADTLVYDTLTAANKCDSIVTVNIIVNKHATGDTTIVDCDSVVFKGIKYTANAVVYDTLTAANKCDSIVTVNIIVNKHATGDTTITECDSVIFKGIKYTANAVVYDTLTAANKCDSIVTVNIIVNHSALTTEVVDTCNMYTWHGVRYTKTDIYYDTLQTVHGCDSICKLDLTITLPYQDTLTLEHYYGDRVIMINRHEINALGWKLDSLDLDHPEYVKWYRINAPGDTTYLDKGYYYTLKSGEPLPAGTYYAVINIEPTGGARCGGKGITEEYVVKGAALAPALMPSLARPGQDIRIVNLNPMVQTNVRIYSADGLVQGSYTVSGEESYTIKAAGTTGFYLVELYNEGMKSTLRYIVK